MTLHRLTLAYNRDLLYKPFTIGLNPSPLKPHLNNGQMCEPSNTAIKGKALRVGVAGVKPNVFRGKDGKPDGIDIRILKLLQKQLGFRAVLKRNGIFGLRQKRNPRLINIPNLWQKRKPPPRAF